MRSATVSSRSVFLSTPSARRATPSAHLALWGTHLFLSTPSARRATHDLRGLLHKGAISIHALREEGDRRTTEACSQRALFLSTPSARRATQHGGSERYAVQRFLSTPSARRATVRDQTDTSLMQISIHALREEGDGSGAMRGGIRLYFYPRPPRGGRHVPAPHRAGCVDFYPRPPRGGRHIYEGLALQACPISIHALREEGDWEDEP